MISMMLSSFITGILSTLGIEFVILLIVAVTRRNNHGKENRTENTTDENK